MKNFSLNDTGLPATLLATLLLSACGGGGDSGSSGAPAGGDTARATRTVLVYMVGSDLESQSGAASADLAEMMQVGSTDKLNIIVETGGANKPGWKTVQRHRIGLGAKQTLADLGDRNMGASATLQDFLDWGMRTYPADRYTLVLWDHGGGAVGGNGTVGVDENHGNDALSLPEIRQAIDTATRVNSTRFDLIGFDTCLMATLETAQVVSPYADYMVASEESEPGSGWDYKAWLGALKATPALPTLDLGKQIIDSYFASFASGDAESRSLTLSAVQLARVGELTDELGALASKIDSRLVSMPASARLELAQGRQRSESYGKQHGDDAGMVDLRDLLGRLPASYATEVNHVVAKLDEAVIYSRRASARPNAHGLSIYLPSERTIHSGLNEAIAAYQAIGFSTSWQNMVARYGALADADTTLPVLSNARQTGNQIAVDIGGGDISAVSVYLTHANGDGTFLVLSRDDADSTGGGTASYDFDNQILLVNGQYVYAEELEADPDNGLYTLGAPVLVNGRQATLVILAQVDGTSLTLQVAGQIPDSADGTVSRLMELQSGDRVEPLFLNYDSRDDSTELVVQAGNAFTVGASGMTASIGALPADSYSAFFAVEDFAGNLQYSGAFDLTVAE